MEHVGIENLDNGIFHASVDIPRINHSGRPEEYWRTVEYFKTKEEAIAYAREHFGADEEGRVCLVSTF
jgi:hypothetical protein